MANVVISSCRDISDGPELAVSLHEIHIPDGEDTASLSETRLLLDTTDALLEDRGDLSW